MAGVVFYGSGSVWIPGRGFARFKDGQYETDKADEIAVLIKSYKHDHIADTGKMAIDEKPKRGRKHEPRSDD
jgi:hypothetical protein